MGGRTLMAYQSGDAIGADGAYGAAGDPVEPTEADAGEARHQQRCEAKIPYTSRGEAKLEAKRIERYGRGKKRPYECPLCGYWHLTSLDRRESRKARKVVLGG